jgi:hypothetical protein
MGFTLIEYAELVLLDAQEGTPYIGCRRHDLFIANGLHYRICHFKTRRAYRRGLMASDPTQSLNNFGLTAKGISISDETNYPARETNGKHRPVGTDGLYSGYQSGPRNDTGANGHR